MSQVEEESQAPTVTFSDNTVYCDSAVMISQEKRVPSQMEKLQQSLKCVFIAAVAVCISSLLVAVVLGVIATHRSTCTCDETVKSDAASSSAIGNLRPTDGSISNSGKAVSTLPMQYI
jgi:hypothetical protein